MIQVTELTKTFDGFTALNRLNLNVSSGAIYGLVGINGAGKTTAIKHLMGIFRQDSGEVKIDGQPVFNNAPLKARIGFIPDELYFFHGYTIKALRVFYRNMYKRWNDNRFEALLESFNLEHKMKLNKLSKGMQKQAMFAYVMSIMPDVLILDEPIDGLDPIVRRLIISSIRDDVASRGLTVLVSSHNLKEMEGFCDSVGIMEKGSMKIERNIDKLTKDIVKVQVAFPQNMPEESSRLEGLDILQRERVGSTETIIIRGEEEKVLGQLRSFDPLLLDLIPLTLEEIFMYETMDIGLDEDFEYDVADRAN